MSSFIVDTLIWMLGLCTFLLIYLWIFTIFGFHKWWERYSWYWAISEKQRNNRVFASTIAGAVALWFLWEYLLPDWWKAATPMMSYDDV